MGPRFLVRAAGLEMHPIDQADRRGYLKDVGGVGYCNITKCCTEVCPEHIKITDNAIIPLKERVADEFYDPIQWVWRKVRGRPGRAEPRAAARAAAPGGGRRGSAAGRGGRRSRRRDAGALARAARRTRRPSRGETDGRADAAPADDGVAEPPAQGREGRACEGHGQAEAPDPAPLRRRRRDAVGRLTRRSACANRH